MKFLCYVRRCLLPAVGMVAAVFLLSSFSFAGKSGATGLSLLQGEFSSPRISGLRVTDSRTVLLEFDRPAASAECTVRKEMAQEGDACEAVWNDDCSAATFRLPYEMEPGASYILSGVVADRQGNTLTMSIPFCGYNARPARLVLAEVRNAYSSKKQQYEFIRLCCLASGNTAGFELVGAGDGEQCAYLLPPMEVRAGESVTVHLRKMRAKDGSGYAQQGMIDEVNGRMDESFAADSSASAWDLWVENEKSRLAPSDILVLRNKNDGSVADALLYTVPEKASGDWDASYAAMAQEVLLGGVWTGADGQPSSSRQSAFLAEGITSAAVTRSLLRRNCAALLEEYRSSGAASPASSAADWSVAVRSARPAKKSR
ncbi:MAG TPA: hypothetical protein DDW78_04770 [Treponema sp.]|nr:hypothetical protein [Treponema sp.]